MAYAFQKDENKEQLAYARVDGVNASYRDLCNVCSNIKGRRADKAVEYLEQAFDKKRPIRYFRHNKKRGHLHELGGKKGGYPIKSVKIVLDVLKNAVANADSKGLGDCKIVHVCANKQLVYGRLSPKGRRMRQNYETAFVEVVVRELQTEENLKKKAQIKAKREAELKAAEEAKKKAQEQANAKADSQVKSDSKQPTNATSTQKSTNVIEGQKTSNAQSQKAVDSKVKPQTLDASSKKKMSEVLAEQKKASSESSPVAKSANKSSNAKN